MRISTTINVPRREEFRVGSVNDEENLIRETQRYFDDDGLKINSRMGFFHTHQGSIVKPEQLRAKCFDCDRLTDDFSQCRCGKFVCVFCLVHIDGIPYCASCGRIALLNLDTWSVSSEDKGNSKSD